MLSPSVTLMLDRVRSEFGIQADVLDVSLASTLVPERPSATGVRIRPELTAAAHAAVRDSRSAELELDGRLYRLLPLRRNRMAAALLVIETQAGPQAMISGRTLDAFLDLLRSAIEADLTSREDVYGERQQNRTLRGVLRFLRYVLLAGTEEEVAEAVIHAAAVWFDVDARVYRREGGGDYVLFSYLPAADIFPGSERFQGLVFAADLAVVRLASVAELRGLGGNRDGVLVPAWGAHSAEWVLALFGNVPAEAELTLSIVGRVIGAQMERLALRRDVELRSRFEQVVTHPDRPTELTAVEAMRQLLWMTGGAAAALWVHTPGGVRRIALVGSGLQDPGEVLPDQRISTGTRYVRTLTLGDGVTARLEIIAPAEAPFAAGAQAVVDNCAAVLTVWLAGTGVPEQEDAFEDERLTGFVRRIEEELARARRFDRRLALLLVQAGTNGAAGESIHGLVEVLRSELRESDLLGMLGRDRIVALLVETDSTGVGSVVRRVRARLGEAVTSKGLPNLAIGEAAFSEECTTVDALLTRAEVNAQAVSDAV